MPSEPEALMEHDALRILARTGDALPWKLTRGDARWEGIPPGRATVNSPELLMRMAVHGAGIAIVNDHFARRICSAANSSRYCRTGVRRRLARGRCIRAAG